MARGNRSQRRRTRPDAVTLRDRLRRLPNSIMLYVTFVLAVGAAILATFPYDVVATAPVPEDEIQTLATAPSTSSSLLIENGPPGSLVGTTSTTVRTALETHPRVNDGILECGPPLFELAVPGKDRRVARSEDCLEGARWRLTLAGMAGGVALVSGLVARRIRLKRYERIAKEERRRLLRRRAPAEPDDGPGTERT